MQFSESEYAKMKWDVSKSQNIPSDFPELHQLFSEAIEFTPYPAHWKSFFSPHQLIKYVVLVYHRLSPLAIRIPAIVDRKKAALVLSGVDLKAAEMVDEVKAAIGQIIYTRHPFVNYFSLHFLKNENALKWLELQRVMEAYEDALYEMQQETKTSDKKSSVEMAKIKTDLFKNTKFYRDEIDRLSAELYQEDVALQNFMASHIMLEKRKAIISPEIYATAMAETGGKPFS